MSPEEAKEIDAYIERFKDCTPEELLRYMGEARDFFWKHMTPEGKQFFQATRFGDQPEHLGAPRASRGRTDWNG